MTEVIVVLSILLITVTVFWFVTLSRLVTLDERVDDAVDVQDDLRLKIVKLRIRLDAIKETLKGNE